MISVKYPYVQQEIGLVLRIGEKFFNACPVCPSASGFDDGGSGEDILLIPIKENVIPATAKEVDKLLNLEQIPDCWRHFGKNGIAYDANPSSIFSTPSISFLKLSFVDGKWQTDKQKNLFYALSVTVFLARFKTE